MNEICQWLTCLGVLGILGILIYVVVTRNSKKEKYHNSSGNWILCSPESKILPVKITDYFSISNGSFSTSYLNSSDKITVNMGDMSQNNGTGSWNGQQISWVSMSVSPQDQNKVYTIMNSSNVTFAVLYSKSAYMRQLQDFSKANPQAHQDICSV